MNIYEFMSDSPIVACFLGAVIGTTVAQLGCFLINRPLRHLNIWKHGYPPEHCDADGDFRSGWGDH